MRRLLAFAALLLLAACAKPATPKDTVPPDADLVVTAAPGLRFDAKSYGPVPSGDVSIAYRNTDQMRHTLVLAKLDASKEGTLVPGFKLVVSSRGDSDSATVTLEPGEYVLICDVPGHASMKASLTVS